MRKYFSSSREARPVSSFGEYEPNLTEANAQKRLMDRLLAVASGDVAMPEGNPARDSVYRFHDWLVFTEKTVGADHRAKISKVITDAEESFYKKKREVALGGAGKDGGEPSPDSVRGFLGAVLYHMMAGDKTLSVADMKRILHEADNLARQYSDEKAENIGLTDKKLTIARKVLVSMTKRYSTRNA